MSGCSVVRSFRDGGCDVVGEIQIHLKISLRAERVGGANKHRAGLGDVGRNEGRMHYGRDEASAGVHCEFAGCQVF